MHQPASILIITALMLAVSASAFPFPAADPAKLRRIPRIYNALITTDEQLLPSQAYPAVAPVLRPHYYTPELYVADPYGLHAYSRLPGFNDTLRDPAAAIQPQQPQGQLPVFSTQPQQPQGQLPVFSMQPQQAIPQITDMVKNNRPNNPDIPDVPPPPLPVSPPRAPDDKSPERKPEEYPPAPSQGLPF